MSEFGTPITTEVLENDVDSLQREIESGKVVGTDIALTEEQETELIKYKEAMETVLVYYGHRLENPHPKG